MLKKSKSIKQIFEEAKSFDLIITSDAPLATALNKHIDYPRLDYFAITPRQIASKFGVLNFPKIYSKPELILEITKQSGKPLKRIHLYVEKIIDVWNNTGLLESCIQFLSKDESEIIGYFEKYPTVELAMEKFDEDFLGDKRIAVAGLELFNLLDRQVLPKKMLFPYEVKLFSGEENKFEKTFIFNSTSELINQTVSLITKENENEIAVVLDTKSDYLGIIKSRLNEKGINLQIKKYLSEDISVRNIISMLHSSFVLNDLKVIDIFYMNNIFNVEPEKKYQEHHFKNYVLHASEEYKKIYEFMSEISYQTYRKILERLEKEFKILISDDLKRTLIALGIYDENVSEENLDKLNYFIKSIDVETSRNIEGVLFASSSNSAFIDRQIVIFAGMDESWTRQIPENNYTDKSDEEKKNLDKFQLMFSQGEYRYNFAVTMKDNEPVLPCYYFNILIDKEINSFDNKCFSPIYMNPDRKSRQYIPKKENFNFRKLNDIDSISATSLREYFICPKKYSYRKLLPSEEKIQLLKGTLFHNFAEFYFNHPGYVRENFENIQNLLLEKFRGFVKEMNEELERSVFGMGMRLIMEFQDSKKSDLETTDIEIDKPDENENGIENFLFEKTGTTKIYSNTESNFKSAELLIKGKIDLASKNLIFDYKSGRRKPTAQMLMRQFKYDQLEKIKSPEIDFQTVMYLAALRNEKLEEDLKFIYYYFMSEVDKLFNDEGAFNGEVSIRHTPKTFREYVLSRKFFNDSSEMFENKVGYESCLEILEKHFDEIDFHDQDSVKEVLEEKFYDLLINRLGFTHTSFKKFRVDVEKKFREEIILKFLKKFVSARTEMIFKEDVDNFLKTVREKVAEINKNQNSSFPNKPIFNLREVCRKCEYLNICGGNKLNIANEFIVDEEFDFGGYFEGE